MKRALIIGGTGTLGNTLVRAFESENPIATFRTTPADTDAEWHPLDLSLRESCDVLAQTLRDEEIASCIICPGANQNRLLLQESVSRLEENLTTFVLNVRHLVLSLTPQLNNGSVVFISSMVGVRGAAGQSVYASVKGALIGLCYELAESLAAEHIRVNTILPGVFDSRMTASLDENQRGKLEEANVLRRGQEPEEIARFVKAITEMKNISGQVLAIDSRIRPV